MQRQGFIARAALHAVACLALTWGVGVAAASAQVAAITAANWGEAVGFRPKLDTLTVPIGTVIHKGNVDQVKAMLAPGLEMLVREYRLKLSISAYQPYSPSQGYLEATNVNRGKATARDASKDFRKAGWSGYVSGLPFPKPQDGLQVAYNFLNTYGGDDFERNYDVTCVSAKSGIETTEYWRWISIRTANRTDLDPRPTLPTFEQDRYSSAFAIFALEPHDKRRFGGIYSSSLDPVDITGHVYVPAQRRTLRQSFGTRGDAWNATDLLYEDVGGYLGAAEWMNWKIVDRKTMLLPFNSGARHGNDPKAVFEVDEWPHWNPKVNWQPRPVYVLEVKPKIPNYPYTSMLMLVDAESYVVHYKEGFDKTGELLKIILQGGNPSPDPKSRPTSPGFGLALDVRAQHATLLTYRRVSSNSGLDEAALSPRRRRFNPLDK